MTLDKPFLTIDEQIALLRSRGLLVTNDDRKILMREGYYSVVNGYKDPFIDRQASSEAGDDRYRENTSFKHLYMLFDLDRSLKQIVFPYLVKAETTIDTALAYSFSSRHREHDAYLQPDNYCSYNQYHIRSEYNNQKNRLISILKNARYGAHVSQSIEHYRTRYGHVPLWVLINSLTFGNVSHMYALSQKPVQNDVCRMIEEEQGMGRLKAESVRKSIATLVDFRNVCAHDDRLYCARKGSHKDKTFAHMIAALKLFIPQDDIALLNTRAADTINELRFAPHIQYVVLDNMQMTIKNGMLAPSQQ